MDNFVHHDHLDRHDRFDRFVRLDFYFDKIFTTFAVYVQIKKTLNAIKWMQ
jgi:hypothetical protein